ncbi:MAG: hypothetical protein IBJ10_07115 [Phycisphaerales bacterium]|nr:hypothetical protein [Phycisphaerales bacterium]
MPDPMPFAAWLAQQAPAGRSVAPLSGAAILLGAAAAAAVVLLLLTIRIGRRWITEDRPRSRRAGANHASRVDPWFEAGRRLKTPEKDKGPQP